MDTAIDLQVYTVRQIEELGLPYAIGGSMVASALDGALQPGVAARARSVAPEVHGDGAQEAARRLVAAATHC